MKPSKIFVCEKCNRAFLQDLSNYANFIGGHSRCNGDLQTCVPTSAVIEMIKNRIKEVQDFQKEAESKGEKLAVVLQKRVLLELESLKKQIEEMK